MPRLRECSSSQKPHIVLSVTQRQGNGGAKRTTIAGRCSVPAMSGCGGKPISADAVFSENLLLVA
jgi:hypothetical protein